MTTTTQDGQTNVRWAIFEVGIRVTLKDNVEFIVGEMQSGLRAQGLHTSSINLIDLRRDPLLDTDTDDGNE